MAKVIKLPVKKATRKDLKIMRTIEAFKYFGFTDNEARIAAIFMSRFEKLERKVKHLEKGKFQ